MKKYEMECGSYTCCSPVSEIESQNGDWCRWEDVEPILNSLQQLKAEILPLLIDALEEFADRKFNNGEFYLKQAMAKLSAI